MRLRIYNLLVNRTPGIRERYLYFRENHKNRAAAWLYLIWLNIAFYFLHIKSIGKRQVEKRNQIKLPDYGVTESERIPWDRPEEAAKSMMQYDVVSFDVFDTLLFRSFREPTDLYLIMEGILDDPGFYRERRSAEQKAREESLSRFGHGEVKLDDIWAQLEISSGIPASYGADLEFAQEKKYTGANPYMLEIVKLLKQQNKKIIACSDMYLSSEQIKELIKLAGYPCFDLYLVSCEHGCSKADGGLYRILKAELKDGERLIHIGDNFYSDIKKAKENGLKTWHYQPPFVSGKNYRPRNMSQIIGSIYAGIINNTIYNGIKKYSMEYELGFIYGGLLATGYCQFIHEFIINNNIDSLLFLSRDGHVLWKLYQRMYPNDRVRIQYVYWSRLVGTKLAAGKYKSFFLANMIDYKVDQKYSIKDIFSTMAQNELLAEFLAFSDLSDNDLLDENAARKLRAFLCEKWDTVLESYQAEKDRARNYYMNVLEGSKRAAAVDVGWLGSGARTLRYLIQDEWRIPCEIFSILAGTMDANSGMQEANEASILLGREAAYLFSPFHNRDLWMAHDGTSGHNMIVELLLSTDQPSFKGFSADLKNPFIFSNNVETINSAEIQKGILDFAEMFEKYAGHMRISGRDAMAPLLVLYDNPKWIQKCLDSSKIRKNIE